ncbi:hypothetical protein M569_04558 [Genlisea aurea]|uniref:Glabrous enhancer-binding protein-like DBD domain-containing protein n=1 Tax=Genlisea aurea TaxID=192259 RepID=S8CSF9_9LAMI|nr:hypothetical protein M569_04558 [Genlisea aurea]
MARNQEKTTRPDPVHDEKEEEQEDSSEEEVEEEEDEEEEGENESGSGSEQAQAFLKSPALPPQKAASGESSSEDQESGSDTESEERTPQKPVKKEAPKKTSSSDQKTAGGKRLADEKKPLEAKSVAAKKAKTEPPSTSQQDGKSQKKGAEPGTDAKKQLFQRIWSEESEIVLLEGMIEFLKEKKADPYSQLNDFHAFIKQKLNIDASRTQLQSKIRNLRKKYQNSKKRASKNNTDEDEGPVFSKPHEHKSYELSKKIWGDRDTEKSLGGKSKSAIAVLSKKTPMKKENGSTPTVVDNEVEGSHNVNSRAGVVGISSFTTLDLLEHEKILAIGSEIFEGEKAVEGREEWERLRLEGMKLHMKRLNVMSQQTKLLLDNWKPKNI